MSELARSIAGMEVAAVGLGIAIAIAGFVAARWFRRHGRSRAARRTGRIAVEGEREGAVLLARAGYVVIDRQVSHEVIVEVDGEPYAARLRCDYLVERRGKVWVAEIKTGEAAPSLTNPATRRQLLEYQVAYGVAGVVLVDATAATVHEVRFDLAPPADPPAITWPLFVAGLGTGAALVAALGWWP